MVIKSGAAGDDAEIETIAREAFDGGRVHEDDEMERLGVRWPVHDGLADGKFLTGCIIADVDTTEDTADDGVF